MPSPPPVHAFDAWQFDLHGHRVIYRIAGQGPPVVLIHGMVNSSRHWESVAQRLAADFTVIAPDLIGHGDSATPRGDYSLGAHAAVIRDLLAAIDVERATMVGHSLGGGVAMQFFYQFPQCTERLVLVSSGGLGHEVSPLLRGAALPGASALLSLAAHPRLVTALSDAGERMRERGSGTGVYLQAIARALRPLSAPDARHAFLETLRSVIDVRGQRVSARDRLYLLRSMPTLIVWASATTRSRSPTDATRTPRSLRAASSRSRAPRTSPISRTPRGSPPPCATFSRRPSPRASRTRTGAA